ncbi:timeless-domain-containing protein [Podospora fimiseda]|uniref:Topoisomerase 1-associated factor 1 n=1 Tax=Podospora fimiseda TaxID=252190 RepID=A0AAN7BHU5_9PEZI|nr:timeless-domain-containing protein [Podospora fimiseda]
MDDSEVDRDVVHPQVRAHINSLVSALGGLEDDGYKLGDDALEVLRDLKRWIRFYDEKTNRMDVARCIADSNIVATDLLQILALWPPSESESKYKSRLALACFEIIVPLTWPIDKDKEAMTINHHRHMPVLHLAQLNYKRAIINFDSAQILTTAIRIALPSLALANRDRTARDQAVIKLVLFFIRNIAQISPPPRVKYDGDESQISRSTLIDAFSFQDVLLTILTFASNMGDDFRTEDTVVMEIIFHLIKRVDPKTLFISEKELHKTQADELTAAFNKEAAMLQSYNKGKPTRHSRFGTMIWVKRENGKNITVSGQDALADAATRERKMDSTKTFKPPRRPRKEEMEPKDLGPPVTLDERARQQLTSFVSEFLDTGFNPLFGHVRASIEREAPHVLEHHKTQFFYTVAWFLKAERMRRKANKESKEPRSEEEIGSYNLVAEVFQQPMLVGLRRFLIRGHGDRDWQLLTTVMRCYTQVLLTVQEMSDSGNEEDEEIADNILSRLFYEEDTHDVIANLARNYKDQGFEYLDACTEFTHTFLRILEGYSKQNVDLQVRTRKRNRKRKKAAKEADRQVEEDGDDAEDDSADDERQAEKTSQDRKFDFKRFATRFVPQGVVDTFVEFTKFYRDLNDEQLKRAHRYFYRVAFKQDMSAMLFRLDIIHLFYNMIKGPEPLGKTSSMFKEWEELSKQIIKKCVRKLQDRPVLFAEILFSKINSTAHYLEYGFEKQTVSRSNPKPGAELEFKKQNLSLRTQIGIVVGVLIDRGHFDLLELIKFELERAESERRAWENANKALLLPTVEVGSSETTEEQPQPPPQQPVDESRTAPYIVVQPERGNEKECQKAMFKNPHLRLLMKLVGMERLAPTLEESMDSLWIFPGSIPADKLKECLDYVHQAEFAPPIFDNEESAEDQLRRKSSSAPRPPRKRAAFDDDDDILDDGEEEDFMFPMGGPTVRKSTAEDRPPKKRRRRERDGEEEEKEIDDEAAAERARERRERRLEKQSRIKSAMYVSPSDDEDDEWDERLMKEVPAAQESSWEKLLNIDGLTKKRPRSNLTPEPAVPRPVWSPLAARRTSIATGLGKNRVLDEDEEDEEGEGDQSDEDGGEEEEEDTPILSSGAVPDGDNEKDAAAAAASQMDVDNDDSEEEDDVPVVKQVRARPRAKAAFLIDSSDEE